MLYAIDFLSPRAVAAFHFHALFAIYFAIYAAAYAAISL